MTASTTEIPELAGTRSRARARPEPWLASETHTLLRSRNFYIALTLVSLVVGALSLLIWVGVMICATLNVEAAPKVPLH